MTTIARFASASALAALIQTPALAEADAKPPLRIFAETEEQKAERRAAIQEGTIASTDAPLRNMRYAVQALEAAEVLSGKFNPNCLSDFGVAVLNLKLCVQGAGMNVKINVPGINDEQVARAYQDKADELEARGSEIADRLYNKTMEEF